MATREKKKALARKEAKKGKLATASLNGCTISARKARVLADVIRGQDAADAWTLLSVQAKKAATPLKKLLDSAIANASERGMDIDKLQIGEIQINKGAFAKRFMPRAQGRATTVRKQTAHMNVALVERT
jgi:large subunit ribosomal protein L22